MKKIIKLIMLMIILLPLTVKADMGAPMIKEYTAIVNEVDGADYYGYETNSYVKKGTLNYNDEITIIHEEKIDNEFYGYFHIENEGYYYIKLSNIIIKENNVELKEEYKCLDNDNENKYPFCSTSSEKMVLTKEGIKLHKGPAYGYEVIANIPKGTMLKYEYASESSAWFYTEYNGVKGWVCELNGAIGTKIEEEFLVALETSLFEKIGEYLEEPIILNSIKANTIIKSEYRTDDWSSSLLINYNGINGYISSWNVASKREKTTITLEENSQMIETMDLNNKKVLIEEIPAGTEITYEYEYEYRPSWFVYTTIGDKTGWVCTEYCESLDENYEYPSEPTTSIETTEPLTSPIVEIEETKSLSGTTIVILCVAGAIIVALTATITIILINKKKKQKKIEPIVVKEVEVTPISDESNNKTEIEEKNAKKE